MAEIKDSAILCSACFTDEGLKISANEIGIADSSACPNCGATDGKKLDVESANRLAHRFYTWGSFKRSLFGGAPELISNKSARTNVRFAEWSGVDAELFDEKLGLRTFYYGPARWMLGETDPIRALENGATRRLIIERIISEYPKHILDPDTRIYRVRRGPANPACVEEYDSPPEGLSCNGRLESAILPVFYGSRDLETCIHECRLTVQDEAFVATVKPVVNLKMLDLTHILREEHVTEFESLDMAVHMLFLADSRSYPISRELAQAAYQRGFDGIMYPSYFSLARTGAMPFPTVMGMSIRTIPQLEEMVISQTLPNVAIFHRPIAEARVKVTCINRITLGAVHYGLVLGPVGFTYAPNQT